MKKFLYWFFGKTAGLTLVVGWQWFWGKPLTTGGAVTLAAAKDSLTEMQASVQNLAESVAQVMAVYEQAQHQFDEKDQERLQLEEKARFAMEHGNEAAARHVMAQVLSLEQLLPQLQQRVEQAQDLMLRSREKLRVEQEKLITYKLEMRNLQAISTMNEALSQVINLAGEVGLDEVRSQFEDSEQAIKNRHIQINSQFELTQNPQEQMDQQLEHLSQTEAIEQRLQALRAKHDSPLQVVPDLSDRTSELDARSA
jgi:phage shock protein A